MSASIPKWKLSTHKILGRYAEELKVGPVAEYRLKNSNGDVWVSGYGRFKVCTTRHCAKQLRNIGIPLLTGWSDKPSAGLEQFIFEFSEAEAPRVLQILEKNTH